MGVKDSLELSQELGLLTLGGPGLEFVELRSEEQQKMEPRILVSRCSPPALGLGVPVLSRGGLGGSMFCLGVPALCKGVLGGSLSCLGPLP